MSMAAAPAVERLARVMALRQRQFSSRIVVAAVVAGIFFGFTGWVFATIWFAAYTALQLLEMQVYRGIDPEAFLSDRLNRRATLFLLAANSVLFGAFGLQEALKGGSWGMVCACLLWAGSIMNSVVVSQGSRSAFAWQALPAAAFYLTAPVFTLIDGAPWIDAGAVIMAGVLNLIVAVTVWAASQKLFEAELRANQELSEKKREAEAATAAKSAFVAMVSHELRTPISAILAGAGEIGAEAREANLRDAAALISDSARMMRTLLNDLLDLSKIEAGAMSVELIDFELKNLVLDTVRFWSSEAEKKGLRLRLSGASQLPRRVRGDPTRLRQILNNLFSNAIKFTEAGSVTLSLGAATAPAGASSVTFVVKDTGRGMTPEQLGRLFRAFEQLGAATARTHGGTGLGLAISRDLAVLMGGGLSADSAPGEGAAFTLTLPFAPAESETAPAETPAAGAGVAGGLRVLVADDHEVNRRAFRLMLEAVGVEVVCVCDGEEALEALEADRFDLVLMDVNMPRLSGLEATRRIRSGGGPAAETPVIALTGGIRREDEAACRAAGMAGFVAKPVEAGELLAAMDAALADAERRRAVA